MASAKCSGQEFSSRFCFRHLNLTRMDWLGRSKKHCVCEASAGVGSCLLTAAVIGVKPLGLPEASGVLSPRDGKVLLASST